VFYVVGIFTPLHEECNRSRKYQREFLDLREIK